MKKLSLLIAGLLFAKGLKADEYKDNPDRFPSIGVFLQSGKETGDSTVTDFPISATQDIERSFGGLVFDLRVPISNSITFNAGLNYGEGEAKAIETSQLLGGKTKTSGYQITAGFRFYMNNQPPAPMKYEAKNTEKDYFDYMDRTKKLNAMLKQEGFQEKEVMTYEDWLDEQRYKSVK